MGINTGFVEFTEDNIKIIELNLKKNQKGGYISDDNKNYIIFINSNIKDITSREHFLKSILKHINTYSNTLDTYDVFLPNGNI